MKVLDRTCEKCGGHYGHPCEGECAPDPNEKVGLCLTCGHSCARMHRTFAEDRSPQAVSESGNVQE